MIAVDTNILVYAHRKDSPWHLPASQAVAALARGKSGWAIAWPCLHEFFAIVTHPRIYDPPSPHEVAVDQIDAWLESPTLCLLDEASTHWETLRALIGAAKVKGPLVHDARIAAPVPATWNRRAVDRRPRFQPVSVPHDRQSSRSTVMDDGRARRTMAGRVGR